MVEFSIVVTTFNDSKFISSFLDGITKEQTVQPKEVVVVDGGSKDSTVEELLNYSNNADVRIRVISDGKRRNIAEGINEGIKQSLTDWVIIMGTGNSYNPEFIQMLLERQEKTSAKVIYSSIIGVEKTKFAHVFNQYFLRGNRPQDLDASNHGVLIHKSVFQEIGYFWENFVYAGEDLEYFARVRRNKIECSCVEEASAYWETPQTLKEYLKKMKVNSIADWQMFEKKHILKNTFVQLFILLLYIICIIICPWSGILIIPLLIVLGIKKKTKNVFALLLGITNRYVMIYYYIKNYKYSETEYHVPDELRM